MSRRPKLRAKSGLQKILAISKLLMFWTRPRAIKRETILYVYDVLQTVGKENVEGYISACKQKIPILRVTHIFYNDECRMMKYFFFWEKYLKPSLCHWRQIRCLLWYFTSTLNKYLLSCECLTSTINSTEITGTFDLSSGNFSSVFPILLNFTCPSKFLR